MSVSTFNRILVFFGKLITTIISSFLWLPHAFVQRRRMIKLVENIPGDPAYPLIGNLLNFFPGSSETVTKYALEAFPRLGNLIKVYVGPLLVVVSRDCDVHELILSGNEYMEKGIVYSFLDPWLGNGLLMSSGEKWRSRRKMLTPAFHFKILDQFVPVFNACGNEFVAQLRRRAGGSPVNIWPLTKHLALDVICDTIMGVSMNAQTSDSSEYVSAVADISDILYQMILQPWIQLPLIFRFTKTGRRYRECLKILHGTTERVIRERRAELEKLDYVLDVDELGRRRRVAFLDLLLLMARDGGLSDEDIREEVDTFMFEGHDTTASAIAFTMYFLSEHPEVQDKLYEELASVFDTTKPLEPTIQELSELKYLEMVIKESLRIGTPVGAIARKITKDLPLKSQGVTLPAGCTLLLGIWFLHQNPEVFPDPMKFDPERFSPEEVARRHPYAYVPFSAGSRNCIGQRFAMLELKSIIAKVIWNFRLKFDDKFVPNYVWEFIIKSKNGLSVFLEERRADSKVLKTD